MKTLSTFLTILFTGIATFTVLGQNGQTNPFDLDELICKEQETAESQINKLSQRTAYSDETDIYYQEMRWEIDPAVYYITGEITYYFKSKKANLNLFYLDLANELAINSITRNGDPVSFTHSTEQLVTIDLGKSLALGESDTLTIKYEGAPPSNGFGSFEQGTHAGIPIIWTLSEPYGVRDWWPGKQDLADKIDSVDIYITTPIGQLAASNGKLMSIIQIEDGKLIHHWQHRHPIVAYLICLAVTNYASYSDFLPLDNGDSLEILNYVYPETLTQSQQETQSVLDILTFYNSRFGLYPFADEKYGYAQFGWGGGEEHQTMSFMVNFNYSLQAHETAHQWFGDKVTCGSWSDIWLNEGFATYLTGLTYEEFSPDNYWPQWRISTSNSATSQPGGSVYVDDTTSVNRIFSSRLSYNKGAYVLHMLRGVIGDDAFFTACRNYLDGAGTAYDFGTTDELQNYMEQESGKDLNEFLADWFYGQGYPSYDLTWTQQADSLVFWLGQRQSHPSVSFFEMPVPVSVKVNGEFSTFILDHNLQNQRFAYYVGNASIDSVTIDPARWILTKNNTVTEVITGTYNPLGQEDYTIFPNPASAYISISPSAEVYSVDLIDADGKVSTKSVSSGRLSTGNLPSGHYTIALKNGEGEILSVQSVILATH